MIKKNKIKLPNGKLASAIYDVFIVMKDGRRFDFENCYKVDEGNSFLKITKFISDNGHAADLKEYHYNINEISNFEITSHVTSLEN